VGFSYTENALPKTAFYHFTPETVLEMSHYNKTASGRGRWL